MSAGRFRVGFSVVIAFLVAFLAACGVGGSDEDAPIPAHRDALPVLVQDINPDGDRLDMRARNYFAATKSDKWNYDLEQAGVTTIDAATRMVLDLPGTDTTISESVAGVTEQHTYRKAVEGVVLVDPLPISAPPAARALVGELLIYPEPFYPTGAVRRIVRQGGWGTDRDGDGIEDSFRLELTQVLVGFETMSVPPNLHVPRAPTVAVHFRNVLVLTHVPSKLEERETSVTSTEDSWWASNIGLLRTERSTARSDGATVVAPYTLKFASGKVGILDYFRGPPLGSMLDVRIGPSALVYDAGRRRYYGMMPDTSGSNPGSRCIASIDADSGAVSYSASLDNALSALALSADGGALYVALIGKGEIVKLRLPDMVELSRTALPPPPVYPVIQVVASIAVSPTEPDTVAVSISGYYGGTVLIRNGVLQPRMTGAATNGRIVFDPNGRFVYNYSGIGSAPALYRLEVQADGLVEQAMQPAMSNNFAALDYSPQGLIANSMIYRTSDLLLAGAVSMNAGAGCRALTVPGRMVCFDFTTIRGEGTLNVVDADSLDVLSQSSYWVMGFDRGSMVYLVPGPDGQVAILVSNGSWRLWLINPNLR